MPHSEHDRTDAPEQGQRKRPRRLWLWPVGIGGVVVLAAFVSFAIWPTQLLSLLLSTVLFSGRPDVPDPDFYFHVHADLVFDGEPVLIDGWVACRGRITKYPGQKAWRTNYHLSAQFIGTRLTSGGSINMGIPGTDNLCHLTVSGNPLREDWQVSGERIPLDVLPAFYWTDDADRPTKGEIYVSEDYYGKPYARLEIKSFRFGGFTKTLPEQALLFDYLDPPSRDASALVSVDGFFGLHEDRRSFRGAVMRTIGQDIWHDIPEIAEFVEGLEDRGETVRLNGEALDAAWPLRISPTGSMPLRLTLSGVPRRHTEGGAMITSSGKDVSAILERLDTAVPMACDAGWATPVSSRIGYWPICAFSQNDNLGVRGVFYRGQRFESPNGKDVDVVLYDPELRALIIFDDIGV